MAQGARPYTATMAESNRRYRALHREEILAKKKAYYQTHKVAHRAAMERYRQTRKDEYAARQRRWRASRVGVDRVPRKKTETARAYNRAYNLSVHGRAIKKAWRQRHREALTDLYIANVIFKTSLQRLSPDLIEATRAILRVKSLLPITRGSIRR